MERGQAQGKSKHELMDSGQWPALVRGLEGKRLKVGDKEIWDEACGWTYGTGIKFEDYVPLSVMCSFSLDTFMIFFSFQQFDYDVPVYGFLSIYSV